MVNVKDGTEKIPRAARVLFGSQHRLSILNLEFNKFGFWYICVSHTPHKLKRPDKSKIRTKKIVSPKNSVHKRISKKNITKIHSIKRHLLLTICIERVCPLIKHSIVIVIHCLNPT